MKTFENGDYYATVSVVVEMVDEEGNVTKKSFSSIERAEEEAMRFTGLLQDTLPPLEPEEAAMYMNIEHLREICRERIFHIVNITGEYIGWSSDKAIGDLKDFAGKPVIVLSEDDCGCLYEVNGWKITYSPEKHAFKAERNGSEHFSDSFWYIVGKCKG